MYAQVRLQADAAPERTLARFRADKDALFGRHPDSPIPEAKRASFSGLAYWPHDPELRFVVPVDSVEPAEATATSISGEAFRLRRVGQVVLPVGTLEVYWIEGYGDGIFVPFRDTTAGSETYAAGRYLLDTVKGADLGGDAKALVLDFNYAYHPSCAYDPVWSCPLAPRANWLDGPIRAGERLRGSG